MNASDGTVLGTFAVGTGPNGVAFDGENVWVANYGNNTVTQYQPPYLGASWITLSNGISNPQALALSPPTTGTPL